MSIRKFLWYFIRLVSYHEYDHVQYIIHAFDALHGIQLYFARISVFESILSFLI